MFPRKKAPQIPGTVRGESGIIILMRVSSSMLRVVMMVLMRGKVVLTQRRGRIRRRCKRSPRKVNAGLSLLACLESLGLT